MLLLIEYQIISMIRYIFFIFPVLIFGQNIDMYISLIDEGQINSVEEKLPELISKISGLIILKNL